MSINLTGTPFIYEAVYSTAAGFQAFGSAKGSETEEKTLKKMKKPLRVIACSARCSARTLRRAQPAAVASADSAGWA